MLQLAFDFEIKLFPLQTFKIRFFFNLFKKKLITTNWVWWCYQKMKSHPHHYILLLFIFKLKECALMTDLYDVWNFSSVCLIDNLIDYKVFAQAYLTKSQKVFKLPFLVSGQKKNNSYFSQYPYLKSKLRCASVCLLWKKSKLNVSDNMVVYYLLFINIVLVTLNKIEEWNMAWQKLDKSSHI